MDNILVNLIAILVGALINILAIFIIVEKGNPKIFILHIKRMRAILPKEIPYMSIFLLSLVITEFHWLILIDLKYDFLIAFTLVNSLILSSVLTFSNESKWLRENFGGYYMFATLVTLFSAEAVIIIESLL